AHVHEALDARRRRRGQEVTRPGDVVAEEVGAVTGAGNPRRTVDDRVHTLERLRDARVVAEGGHDLFHVLPLLAEAGEANHGADVVTALTERREHVLAEEPGSAGDEHGRAVARRPRGRRTRPGDRRPPVVRPRPELLPER